MWTPKGWVRLPLDNPPSDSFNWSATYDTLPVRAEIVEFLLPAGTELARSPGAASVWPAVGSVCLAIVVVILLFRGAQSRISRWLYQFRSKPLAAQLRDRV